MKRPIFLLLISFTFFVFGIDYPERAEIIENWNKNGPIYAEKTNLTYWNLQEWHLWEQNQQTVDGNFYLNWTLPLDVYLKPQQFRKDKRTTVTINNLNTKDSLSFQLEPFKTATEKLTKDECKNKGGLFTKKKKCRFVYILEEVCLRVSYNKFNHLEMDKSFGKKNFDKSGCFADSGIPKEFGQFSIGKYKIFPIDGDNYKKQQFNWENGIFSLKFSDDVDVYDQKKIFTESEKQKNDEL